MTKNETILGAIIIGLMIIIITVINVHSNREEQLKETIVKQNETIKVLEVEAKHSKLLKELL